VLGFDTEMSTDHDWGPRVMLFLNEEDHSRIAAEVEDAMRRSLPRRFRGYSTHFGVHGPGPKPLDGDPAEGGPFEPWVDVIPLKQFFRNYLGFNLDDPLEPAD